MRITELAIGDITVMEKRLGPRDRAEAEAILCFESEAKLLSLLAGQSAPRLLSRGADAHGPWLHTEKLAFDTLATRIEKGHVALRDKAWLKKAATSAMTALAGLHEAVDGHGALGIVHADISPANVAIADDGAVTVFLDFELACWRESPKRDGAFRGTIAYAAPEVARGEKPTVESDLFALAATMLHAVTGVAPRQGESFAAMLAEAAEVPIAESAKAALVSVGLDALARCLAHEAAERPCSAREAVKMVSDDPA